MGFHPTVFAVVRFGPRPATTAERRAGAGVTAPAAPRPSHRRPRWRCWFDRGPRRVGDDGGTARPRGRGRIRLAATAMATATKPRWQSNRGRRWGRVNRGKARLRGRRRIRPAATTAATAMTPRCRRFQRWGRPGNHSGKVRPFFLRGHPPRRRDDGSDEAAASAAWTWPAAGRQRRRQGAPGRARPSLPRRRDTVGNDEAAMAVSAAAAARRP